MAGLSAPPSAAHENHMRCKGTMLRDGEPLGPVYRYPGDGYPGAPEPVETAAEVAAA